MVRTQIQLPDSLYDRLKRLSEVQEWSMAETIRRGAELLLRSFPAEVAPAESWTLPSAVPLGEFGAPVEQWRELAEQREP